jgi:hypothetical protein
MAAGTWINRLTIHLLVALAVSFGLSVAFWLILGTFVPFGFFLWSAVCAVIGALAGALWRDRLLDTAVITAVIRVVVYGVMVYLI